MRVSYDVDLRLGKGGGKVWKLDVQVWGWRVIETCVASEAVERWIGWAAFER
jgi:hypothetical protein